MKEPLNNKELIDKLKESCANSFAKNEKEQLWLRIKQSTENKPIQKKTSFIIYFSIAASICGLIFILNFLFQKGYQPDSSTNTSATNNLSNMQDSSVMLITADGKQKNFDGEEPSISTKDYVNTTDDITYSTIQNLTLIVPSGKRTCLTLEDGTRLWINSDSKVSYPEKFAQDQRIIEIEGEVFAEVSPDKNKPFIVKTNDFEIKVLGTSFNVSAYKEDKTKGIVLVTGKVEVNTTSTAENKIQLSPNSMLTVEGEDYKIQTGIDVYDYICWKDNILSLNATSLDNITNKLNRYYNSNIIIDNSLISRKLSGKLNLKNSFEETTKALATSLNCKYKKQDDGSILIYPR